MRHVGVQDATGLWQALVQLGMQIPGSRIGRVGALRGGLAGRVEQQQLAGADAREMRTNPIEQKTMRLARQHGAEMVGDRFVHAQPGGPAKGRCQVDAGGGFLWRV